jgi:hypothetical protein
MKLLVTTERGFRKPDQENRSNGPPAPVTSARWICDGVYAMEKAADGSPYSVDRTSAVLNVPLDRRPQRSQPIVWLRGVDLNHRPLGYEPTCVSIINNLQDAGGSANPCKYE